MQYSYLPHLPLLHLISPIPNPLRHPVLLLLSIDLWANILLILLLLSFVSLGAMIGHCERLFLPIFLSDTERFLMTFLQGKRLKIDFY
jgi:hypothetical protein